MCSLVQINWLALLFMVFLTALLMLGTSEGTMMQNCSMAVYLVLISFIIFGGASQVDQANYTPYAPFGINVSKAQALFAPLNCIRCG